MFNETLVHKVIDIHYRSSLTVLEWKIEYWINLEQIKIMKAVK